MPESQIQTLDSEFDPDEALAEPGPLAKPKFEVVDTRSANCVVLKINEARAYAKMVKAWAKDEIAKAEKQETGLLAHFGVDLENVAAAEVSVKNLKSISLPAGRIGFRKSGDILRITDDLTVIEWAKQHLPEALKVETKYTLVKAALDAHFKSTGYVPDGCAYEPETEKFYVGEK